MPFHTWVSALPDEGGGHLRPYQSYCHIWNRVDRVVRDNPSSVHVRPYGRSINNEPLWEVSVAHAGASEPPVLVLANLHSMEHVGPATVLALLERAANDPGPWKKRRLHLVPVANPDGFLEIEAALSENKRPFVRKNRSGVDLNRNFGEFWDDRYYLNRLLKPVFASGSAPLSEPETRFLDQLAQRVRPGFAVSLHAFGEWIYTPYAGRRDRPPDYRAMKAVACEMAARQPEKSYRVLQLARRSRFFAARGAEIDHFYVRYGAFSFLIEIGAGPRFAEPQTWFHPYRWFTPPDPRLEADVANLLPALDFLAIAKGP